MVEEWREIPGTLYSVSSEGRIASRKRGKEKFLRPALAGNGYLMVVLRTPTASGSRTIHSVVGEVFLGPRPTQKHQINHKNGDKTDNQVGNLEWITAKENSRHSYDVLGNHAARGEAHGAAKLTEGQVREIRSRCMSGESQSRIAKEYGIAPPTVSNIARRKKWAWLL